jgi:hypothetical protein
LKKLKLINKKQRNIGVLIGLAATFIPVLWIELNVLKHTNGSFIYPVDDTFIHLELANNLAHYGNWGINSHEFGSASSSLLYTLILALFTKLFSSVTLLPFIVNAIAGILLLIAVNNWLAKQHLSVTATILINLLVVFFTPLPILIISGMEHTLQCLFSFLFLFHSCEWISKSKEKEQSQKLPWSIPLYTMLLTAIRYEGLFLIAIVCVVFLYYRKLNSAIKTGIIALLPVIVFGIYSISKGSYFLPNSILIKSNEVPLFGGGIAHFFETLFVEKLTLSKPGITAMATQRLLLILPAMCLLFFKQLKKNLNYALILIGLTVCTLLHLSLASTGKFYRYEAYLIACSILVCSTVFFKYFKEIFAAKTPLISVAAVFLFFFLLLPVVLRSTAAFSKAQRACINIYEQQYQMGHFLRNYYPDTGIAANDIGAVSYFTKGNVVDLWGLGTIEVSKSRRGHYWNAGFLDSLSRQKNVKIAVIYDSWFNNSFESRWKKIATWQIPDNVVCGDDIVSFYAVDTTIAPQLKQDLQNYQKQLPTEVAVKYYE